MPACVDQELLLGGLIDGELDAANTALVEAHVARCDGCRGELERLQAVRSLLAAEGVRYSAPRSLAGRIAALPELSPRAVNQNWLPTWLGPGLAGALAASLAFVAFIPPGSQSVQDQEIVTSHVRSLQPGHLTDVHSGTGILADRPDHKQQQQQANHDPQDALAAGNMTIGPASRRRNARTDFAASRLRAILPMGRVFAHPKSRQYINAL